MFSSNKNTANKNISILEYKNIENNMPNIFPHLHLPVVEEDSKFYSLPFYSDDNRNSRKILPVIAFGYEESNDNQLLISPEDVNMKGSELVRTAFSNLKNIDMNWKEVKQEGVHYLMTEDHPYAAEKILDKAFLAKAEALLGSDKLAVTIPCRGVIIATDASAKESRQSIEKLTWSFYNDITKTQVSDLIFLLENGQIEGCQPIRNYEGKLEDVAEVAQKELPSDFSYEMSPIELINGDLYYKAMLGAPNAKTLFEGAYQLILIALTENLKTSEFVGLIELQSIPTQIKKDRHLMNALDSFFDRLAQSSVMKQWAKRMNKTLSISFIFGEDFQSGSFENKQVVKINPNR